MLHIIWSIIVGFFIGLIALAVVPGAQHQGFLATAILGILGSLVGGLVSRLFSRPKEGSVVHPAGFFMSIAGAVVLLVIWTHVR